jgi:hypothetical protein
MTAYVISDSDAGRCRPRTATSPGIWGGVGRSSSGRSLASTPTPWHQFSRTSARRSACHGRALRSATKPTTPSGSSPDPATPSSKRDGPAPSAVPTWSPCAPTCPASAPDAGLVDRLARHRHRPLQAVASRRARLIGGRGRPQPRPVADVPAALHGERLLRRRVHRPGPAAADHPVLRPAAARLRGHIRDDAHLRPGRAE